MCQCVTKHHEAVGTELKKLGESISWCSWLISRGTKHGDARFTRFMHQTRPWTSLKISQWCLTFRKAFANVLDRDSLWTDQLMSCCGPPTMCCSLCLPSTDIVLIVCWPFVDLVYLVVDCLNLLWEGSVCVCVDRGLIIGLNRLKLILHNVLEVERSQGYGTNIQDVSHVVRKQLRTILHRMAPIHEHVLCICRGKVTLRPSCWLPLTGWVWDDVGQNWRTTPYKTPIAVAKIDQCQAHGA